MTSPNPAGVTIKTAPHGANDFTSRHGSTTSAEDLLKGSCPRKAGTCKELLQSSFFQPHGNQQPTQDAPIYASSHGFVQGAIEAYNQHHHFIIRPEDVWFAILSQFSSYVNKHAEELRDKFVAHEGQKKLEVRMVGSRYTVDFGWFAEAMGMLLEKNVVDPELREWIVPDFSTTTREDTVVASILMMGTLQKYFTYVCCIVCGLPSVTLLGTKGDWENILLRLEKLKTYGEEPTIWYDLLKPVLTKFVETFQSPAPEEVLDFWQKIVHRYSMGSGPTYLSGWITAFCFWAEDGSLLHQDPGQWMRCKDVVDRNFRRNDKEEPFERRYPGEKDRQKEWNGLAYPYLELDGVGYHRIEIENVPPGYGSVPVTVVDNGVEFEATMIAGSVAIKGTSSGEPLKSGQPGLDTMQPVSGWWMFENTAVPKEEESSETALE